MKNPMDLLKAAQTQLREGGYRAWPDLSTEDRVLFEDSDVFGMVTVYPSVVDLIEKWEDRQDQFLRNHADVLRDEENKEKVWNVYTIHFTKENFSEDGGGKIEQRNELYRIEENFRGTRKIARVNITEEGDVVEGLLPLLPIQGSPELAAEDYRERLGNKISNEFRDPFIDVLNEDVPIDEIVEKLIQKQ